MPIRLLLVDDHAVVRQGVRLFLGLDPDLELMGKAANGAKALELARQLQPDVGLLDLAHARHGRDRCHHGHPPRPARH